MGKNREGKREGRWGKGEKEKGGKKGERRKGRTGIGREEDKEKRRKCSKAKENCQKPHFLPNCHLWGSCAHPSSPCECRPNVYSSMPTFIVIGI